MLDIMLENIGYCDAFKFKNEALRMSVGYGNLKLLELRSPSEPLSTLLSGDDITKCDEITRTNQNISSLTYENALCVFK